MRRLRALTLLAAGALLLPTLAGALQGCLPAGCERQAPRVHDCCPPAPVSLQANCCADAVPVAPQPTVVAADQGLVGVGVVVAEVTPPAESTLVPAPVERLAARPGSALHTVLRR